MSRDNIKIEFLKEPFYRVEIDVPRCVNTHGSAPCTATETGDDKCYNTRTTCNDLANYNDLIDTGSISIASNSTSGTFTRSSGSFITDGFEVGQIITVSGFANAGNNSQFEISTITATVITVTNSFGMVTEASAASRQITTPNYYTYNICTERSPHPHGLSDVVPCVKSVNTSPATIDPKGGIGARTSASVNMLDLPGSDRNDIDPYLSDRTYNALDKGLFWVKWRARNANYENYPVRIKSGYIVDNAYSDANFETRHYVLASMSAGNGRASMRLKDPLQLVSNKKALAPKPSTGVLNAAINSSVTTATLSPSGVGNDEYPASGFVRISDEVMSFTRSGDVLTITRGQRNTTATSHDADDSVQLCLQYTGDPVDEVQADLCVTYAGIPAIYVPAGAWQSEASTYLPGNPDALITEPTPVNRLIGELCKQWPHKLFWNDRTRQIEFVALKEPPSTVNTLNGDDDIMQLSSIDKPDMQLSTVLVRYGQIDPTKKLDEINNYKVNYSRVNSDAIARYDSNNSEVIYSRWIISTAGAIARQVAGLIGRRFGITPREIGFQLEDKDSSVWVGDVRNINHHDITDQNGDPVDTTFEIISAKEGSSYDYRALEFNYDKFQTGDPAVGVDVVDFAEDVQDVNLRTEYEAIYGVPSASTEAKFIVYSGAIVGSSSTGTPAMQTGTWPSGATITLQINSGGRVVGYGGNGSSSASTAAENGGDALSLAYDLELVNNGILGGGGGGGGADSNTAFSSTGVAAGGGGAGFNVLSPVRGGQAGSNSFTGTGLFVNDAAQNGSFESGGNGGGLQWNISEPAAASGAAGGDLGQAGTSADSAGGSAGKAVDLNGNTLTQVVGGDIRGTIS